MPSKKEFADFASFAKRHVRGGRNKFFERPENAPHRDWLRWYAEEAAKGEIPFSAGVAHRWLTETKGITIARSTVRDFIRDDEEIQRHLRKIRGA